MTARKAAPRGQRAGQYHGDSEQARCMEGEWKGKGGIEELGMWTKRPRSDGVSARGNWE